MAIILNKSLTCIASEAYANVPAELKAQARWCCYKNEPKPDGGKPSKVPFNPVTGKHARINAQETLCSFDEAVAGFASGRYDGINYGFGYDEFIGIDLDNVLDKATGEFICKEAEEIYNRFKTAGAYIEVSPSGSGLRIICKASSPLVKFGNGRGEFSKFEIYGNGDGGLHFLSITEDVLQAVDKLIDCTSEVN